ncbi:MAG: reductive dehalogenase, partial [Gemmatimonadetes bacterium]|nr:reductive dehalogenase [Gemmatimonadota bacterium]
MDDLPAGAEKVGDREAGFRVGDDFRRFSQRNDIFCRSFWDPVVQSDRSDMFYETYRTPRMRWRNVDGFTQRDYALRNASWHVTDVFAEMREQGDRREGFLDPYSVLREGPGVRAEVESEEAGAREIKHVARTFGADLVGITGYDERWVYTHAYSRDGEEEKRQELPADLPHVIVIAQSMDLGLIGTVPSALSGTATGLGYSKDTLVLLAVSQYILNLGYRAVPTMNDTALAI